MRVVRNFDWNGFTELSSKVRWSAGGLKNGSVEAIERAESVLWHADDLNISYRRLDEILRLARAEEAMMLRRREYCQRIKDYNSTMSAILELFGE